MSKKVAKTENHAIGRAIGLTARDVLAHAQNLLADTSLPDAVVIHEYRRAMKRWRALLRLLEPILGRDVQRFRLEARELARKLAGPRDAQSALDALRDLIDSNVLTTAPSPRALKAIAGRLSAHRKKMEASRLNAVVRDRLARGLEKAESAVGTWPLKVLTFNAILGQFTETYRRARRAVPKNWSRAGHSDLHKLRQRVVEHRYQMELLKPLWPRLGRAWVREAQKLRSQLGKHQDLVVLARLTESGQPLARWRSTLLPIIARRQANHVIAARRLSSRLFAEPPKTFRRRYRALWIAGDGKQASR
jgi:CHAD domain-containing protein